MRLAHAPKRRQHPIGRLRVDGQGVESPVHHLARQGARRRERLTRGERSNCLSAHAATSASAQLSARTFRARLAQRLASPRTLPRWR